MPSDGISSYLSRTCFDHVAVGLLALFGCYSVAVLQYNYDSGKNPQDSNMTSRDHVQRGLQRSNHLLVAVACTTIVPGAAAVHSKPSQLSGQLPSNQHLTKTASCQPASQLVSLQCVAAWLPWAPASCQPVASQFEDPSICASQLPASSRA